MAATYTWSVTSLDRELADGYVNTVHYVVNAVDAAYRTNAYGSVELARPDGDLIPYADLTETLVLQWVKSGLGAEKVAAIETALQDDLNEQSAPSKGSGLPWSN